MQHIFYSLVMNSVGVIAEPRYTVTKMSC